MWVNWIHENAKSVIRDMSFKGDTRKAGLWTLVLWTFGLWTTGRLDSGHLDSGRQEAWTLDARTLGLWTPGLWTIWLCTPGRLYAGRLGLRVRISKDLVVKLILWSALILTWLFLKINYSKLFSKIDAKCYVIKEYWKKFLLGENKWHYKQLSRTVQKCPSRVIHFQTFLQKILVV